MMRTSPILRKDALRFRSIPAVRPRRRRMCVVRAGAQDSAQDSARDSARNKFDAVREKSTVRIAQVAPAVRVAVGEPFGGAPVTPKQLVTALKMLGFDYVFDTLFAADLTIIEEGTELLTRIAGHGKLPMFTSCCPGWIQLAEKSFPEILPNISTTKSPQLILGAIVKNYFANKIGANPEDVAMVSFMPCVRKQMEADREEGDTTGRGRDVDLVLTTNELVELLMEQGVILPQLEETAFDDPLGTGTGGAIIFGRTGGVMLAALRFAYQTVTGEPLGDVPFAPAEGFSNVKEATVVMVPKDGGDPVELRVAVVLGLGDAKKYVKALGDGTVSHHFVEVMACVPMGCVGSSGQPSVGKDKGLLEKRKAALNAFDEASATKAAHENRSVERLYEQYLGEPMGELAHKLLHTHTHSHTHDGEGATELK